MFDGLDALKVRRPTLTQKHSLMCLTASRYRYAWHRGVSRRLRDFDLGILSFSKPHQFQEDERPCHPPNCPDCVHRRSDSVSALPSSHVTVLLTSALRIIVIADLIAVSKSGQHTLSSPLTCQQYLTSTTTFYVAFFNFLIGKSAPFYRRCRCIG